MSHNSPDYISYSLMNISKHQRRIQYILSALTINSVVTLSLLTYIIISKDNGKALCVRHDEGTSFSDEKNVVKQKIVKLFVLSEIEVYLGRRHASNN